MFPGLGILGIRDYMTGEAHKQKNAINVKA